MGYKYLQINIEENIAILILNRPEKGNALSIELRNELYKCLDELEKDENIKIVIITGNGNVFCAGFDLDEFKNLEKAHKIAVYESSAPYQKKLLNFKKPVIAAINGPALSAGLDLSALCDIRIASENASFGHPEIKFGFPPLHSPYKEIIGEGLARDLCLTGRKIDAQEALRIGLVSKIVPSEDLLAECKRWAKEMTQIPGNALEIEKKVFQETSGKSLDESFNYEDKIFKDLWLGDESKR